MSDSAAALRQLRARSGPHRLKPDLPNFACGSLSPVCIAPESGLSTRQKQNHYRLRAHNRLSRRSAAHRIGSGATARNWTPPNSGLGGGIRSPASREVGFTRARAFEVAETALKLDPAMGIAYQALSYLQPFRRPGTRPSFPEGRTTRARLRRPSLLPGYSHRTAGKVLEEPRAVGLDAGADRRPT